MKRDAFLKLLTRKLSADLSASELREFDDAVNSNPEFWQIDEQLTKYFEIKNSGSHDNDRSVHIDHKLQSVWKAIDKHRITDQPLKVNYLVSYSNLLKIAAVIFILLTGGLVFFNYHKEEPLENTTLVNSGNHKIFMTLEDGTKVWLNKQSSVTYNEDFGKVSRKLSLKGEAFFDVIKNPDVPLSIDAGRIKISVKGTAFNVKAHGQAKNIEVALIRGLVELTDYQNKTKSILLKPNEKFVFLPGNGPGHEQYQVLKMNAELENADIKWRLDSLVFKKEKLKDLAQHLEIRYKVKIEIQNEQLKNKRFSGSFTSEPLKDALEALKLSYPLDYQITDQKVIIK
ncbi:MAG TPA: FecR domain-containing protein [Pedobacter sp.]|uniref:FecR family protein n=1 Tax=Pedobacter sp. TaxID=1411316 RepID=UPI002B63B710|nr:FecR domain-containing protein [Pedobacter sp.]HMI03278.1 FecR domain-containing protein [Pedobacter sp.]